MFHSLRHAVEDPTLFIDRYIIAHQPVLLLLCWLFSSAVALFFFPFHIPALASLHLLPPPKVVLATDMSLDYGFSKALLLRWASGSDNTILLTGRGHGDTTARSLLAQLEDRERAAAVAATLKPNAPARRGRKSPTYGAQDEEEGGGEEEETSMTLTVKVRFLSCPGEGGLVSIVRVFPFSLFCRFLRRDVVTLVLVFVSFWIRMCVGLGCRPVCRNCAPLCGARLIELRTS